ncbi:MAG: VOC family protein [Thalassobaculales bacterium]
MLDHVSLGTEDLARAVAFYDAVLAPLGYVRLRYWPDIAAGYGPANGKPHFWIGRPVDPGRGAARAGNGTHICFAAAGRAAVDAFHAAALAAGGRDNGAPGPRPLYHAHYYGAFCLDLDGHAIEACCHDPE